MAGESSPQSTAQPSQPAEQATTNPPAKKKRLGRPSGDKVAEKTAKHGGTFVGHLLGGIIAKVVVAVVIAAVAAFLIADKVGHLFHSQTTIQSTVVLGKLTKIEQVHVASRTYPVNVHIAQSDGFLPCFLVCNEMTLTGSGTDDAVVNLDKLTRKDVSIDQPTKTVTIHLTAPAVEPAVLDPTKCQITSSHGVVNSFTQEFRNNPNGYQPLYAQAENDIHSVAVQDKALLAAGEQSTRQLLTRILGTVGIKKVVVDFS
jgi:hypothetical protein